MINICSVSPTVTTASGPSRPTQKMSTTAKTDSINSSSTIGTASMRTARPMDMLVSSLREPRRHSFTSVQALSAGGATSSSVMSRGRMTAARRPGDPDLGPEDSGGPDSAGLQAVLAQQRFDAGAAAPKGLEHLGGGAAAAQG